VAISAAHHNVFPRGCPVRASINLHVSIYQQSCRSKRPRNARFRGLTRKSPTDRPQWMIRAFDHDH
jgi:hypothetical protein